MTGRVELHCHTNMSEKIGLANVGELLKKAQALGMQGIAITDLGSVQAFPEVYEAWQRYYENKNDSRPRRIFYYGVEIDIIDDSNNESQLYRGLIIAKNGAAGLKSLYELVSLANTEYYSHHQPKLSKGEINKRRANLLIGSCAQKGEIFEALYSDKNNAALKERIEFYDFIEIEPVNNMLAPLAGKTREYSVKDLKNYIKQVAALGKKNSVLVVASSNVYYVESKEENAFNTLRSATNSKVVESTDVQHHLMTTEELLTAFSFLGEEVAREVVLTNPQKVVDGIEMMAPIPKIMAYPEYPHAYERLEEICYEKARELYGEKLPKEVANRLEREMTVIKNNAFASVYMIYRDIIKKSRDAGYPVESRSSTGSSFAAYLADITDYNPLTPHYCCRKCGYTNFKVQDIAGFHVGDVGIDLPDRNCPICGEALTKDGFDLPFESLLGYDLDGMLDFCFNFSDEYQLKAIKNLSEVPGIGGIYWGGSIGSMRPMADKKVKARVKKYIKTNISTDKGIIEEITEKLVGVKWCDGITPGNIFVVPEGFDINTLTPVQDCELGKLTKTHFRHYELNKSMMQIKIYGTKMPTWLKKLKDATGIAPEEIPFNDIKVMESMSEKEAINIIGEFICCMRPKHFSDILRSFGFDHSTGTWDYNAEMLINDRKIPLHECIAFKEDILQTLVEKGMDRKKAFEIMEAVRIGRGLKKEWIESMRSFNIPNWYIDSCKKIRYLFPRASGVSYALGVYRLMYYRYYYPEEFANVMK